MKEYKIKYESTGLVYGNYWGGGQGAFSARRLEAGTKEELLKQAEEGLDGSLDGGMGYESLIGAMLNITKFTTVEIDGREFVNKEHETEFIGDLTDEQIDFLIECNGYY